MFLKLSTITVLTFLTIANGKCPTDLVIQTKDCTLKEFDQYIQPICQRCKPGSDAYVSGDPHFKMWNNAKHSFQGATNGFYYLMTGCKFNGVTPAKMPFNLIAKNWILEGTRFTSVEYGILEIFDGSDRYYVYMRGADDISYYKDTNAKRDIKTIDAAQSRTIMTPGKLTLGTKEIIYNKNTNSDGFSEAQIKLKVKNSACVYALEIVIMEQARLDNGRIMENSIFAKVPACYKCLVCGLFGDFFNDGRTMFNPITGDVINVDTGNILPNGNPTNQYNEKAFNDDYFGCKVRETSFKGMTPNLSKKPICDTDVKVAESMINACKAELILFKNKKTSCCTGSDDACSSVIDDCRADGCECVNEKGTDKMITCAKKQIKELMKPICKENTGTSAKVIKLLHSINGGDSVNKIGLDETTTTYTKLEEYIVVIASALSVGVMLGTLITGLLMWCCCIRYKRNDGYDKVNMSYVDSSSDEEA